MRNRFFKPTSHIIPLVSLSFKEGQCMLCTSNFHSHAGNIMQAFFRTKTEIFNGQITMQLQNFLAYLNGTRAPIYNFSVHFQNWTNVNGRLCKCNHFLVFCLRKWYKTFEKFTRRKFRPVTSSWKLLVILHAAILESCHANNNPV